MANSVEDIGNGTVQWEHDLAVALGYDVSPSLKCILPVHPFAFVGDEVIVREVIVNSDGTAVYSGGFPYREVRHSIPAAFDRSALEVSE